MVKDVISIFDMECRENVFYNEKRIKILVIIVIGDSSLFIILILIIKLW